MRTHERHPLLVATVVLVVGLAACSKKKESPTSEQKPTPDKTKAEPKTKADAGKTAAKNMADAKPSAEKKPADVHYVEVADGPCKAAAKDKGNPNRMTVFKVGQDGKRTKLGCKPPDSDDGPNLAKTVVAEKEPDGKSRAAAAVVKETEKKLEADMVEVKAEWAIHGPTGTEIARVTTEDRRAGGLVHLLTASRRYVIARLGSGINMAPFNTHVYDTKTGKKADLGDTGDVSLKGELVIVYPAPNPQNPEAPATCFDLKNFSKRAAKKCPQPE